MGETSLDPDWRQQVLETAVSSALFRDLDGQIAAFTFTKMIGRGSLDVRFIADTRAAITQRIFDPDGHLLILVRTTNAIVGHF